jgi:hypothetical protein
MKFKLFGGSDCPDLVLSQLAYFTQLSPETVRSLTEQCLILVLTPCAAQRPAAGEALSPTDVENLETRDAAWAEITAACSRQAELAVSDGRIPVRASVRESATQQQCAPLGEMEQAAVLCAITTLCVNYHRYGVPPAAAAGELTMLGLDTEQAEAMMSQLRLAHTAMTEMMAATVPRIPAEFMPSVAEGSGAGEEVSIQLRMRCHREHFAFTQAAASSGGTPAFGGLLQGSVSSLSTSALRHRVAAPLAPSVNPGAEPTVVVPSDWCGGPGPAGGQGEVHAISLSTIQARALLADLLTVRSILHPGTAANE